MQKKSFIVAGGALVAMSLVAAAPAQAADTVTTSDVAPTAWTQVLNPYVSEVPADTNYFADYDLTTEPLTFPFVTPNVVVPQDDELGGGFDLAWLAPAPAESCSRIVNGFTISVTNPAQTSLVAQLAIASSSDDLETVDPATEIDPGAGSSIPGLTLGVVAPTTTQVFTATLASPLAWSDDISAILALEGSTVEAHTYTIDSVTFNVTDTCAEAVVPAVVIPVTPAQAVEPAKPALANTGADFAPMGIAAGALLLGGIAAVGAVSATRRIRSTR